MGRHRDFTNNAEKQNAYRNRIKQKAEQLRQLKLSFDDYLEKQLCIEDDKRIGTDRQKPIWDVDVKYIEHEIKENYLRAINRQKLNFSMSYCMLQYYICKNVPPECDCGFLTYRFEGHCPNCGAKINAY